MPVSANHIDSTQHNDTAVGTYSPQYVEGFPTTQAGDSALGQIDTLAVMEIPDGAEAQPFTRSPLHDTPSMALLLAGMLAVALSYHKGYKYIENFFHYMFSTRRRENLFEDHTVNETGILTALIGNTCIVEGFLIFAAVRMLCPSLAPALQANVFPHIAIYCGIAVLFYVGQWLVYKVLGYTFSDKQGTKLWIDGFKATQAFLGLLLLPVLILLMLYPNHGRLLLSIAVSLYLIARLIFIYKGFRIFYGNLSSILYFLLYLCAVEIVPLAILASVTYWISGIY